MIIAATAIIHENVHLGDGAVVEDFVIVGAPPRSRLAGELRTVFGGDPHLRSHTVIYAGNVVGAGFQCGNRVFVREENDIGKDVSIGTGSIIEHHVRIGNGVRIHSQAFIPEYSILEDSCWIGPGVVLTNALHPRCPEVKRCLKGAHIRKNAIICANATILPEVEIGEGALIGAGSVVVHSVEPFTVVVGNPARFVKRVDELTCAHGLIDKPYSW